MLGCLVLAELGLVLVVHALPLFDAGPHVHNGWGETIRIRRLYTARKHGQDSYYLRIHDDGRVDGERQQSSHSEYKYKNGVRRSGRCSHVLGWGCARDVRCNSFRSNFLNVIKVARICDFVYWYGWERSHIGTSKSFCVPFYILILRGNSWVKRFGTPNGRSVK